MLGMQSSVPGSIRFLCRRAIRSFVRPQVRLVRQSVLTPHLEGDPWVVATTDGRFAVCVGDRALARVSGLSLDLPSFNQILDRVRHRQPRRLSRLAALEA